MKAYRSTVERSRGKEGLVNGVPVEVKAGGGVFVKVQVGVAESPLCKESRVLRVWSSIAFACTANIPINPGRINPKIKSVLNREFRRFVRIVFICFP